MKSSLFNGILCASLLVFAVGCGKDSGGSKNPNYSMNPVINPYMSSNGQSALNNLRKWYAAAESTSTLGFRGTYIKKTEAIGGLNFQIQGSLCIFGFGINCNQQAQQPTNCFRKNPSNDSYDIGTATGTLLTQCTI